MTIEQILEFPDFQSSISFNAPLPREESTPHENFQPSVMLMLFEQKAFENFYLFAHPYPTSRRASKTQSYARVTLKASHRRRPGNRVIPSRHDADDCQIPTLLGSTCPWSLKSQEGWKWVANQPGEL